MESPSAPAHRGRVPWQGLLLAVSLLTFWSPPTTAQLTVASINATEGKDVLLLVHNVPEDLLGYSWYRGESSDNTRVIAAYVIQSQKFIPGPAYSGRETIHPNGSLLLQKVTLNDTGYYTMQALQETLQGDKATGQLHVYHGPDAPSILPSDSHYSAGANLRLSCHAASNPPAQYIWLINGRPQQPTQELFIPSITANDSGSYTCIAHNSVTGLNRTTVKNITVYAENDYTGYPVGTIAGIVIGVLVLVALGTALGCFMYHRRTRRDSDKQGLTEHRPPASTPGQGPSGASTSPVSLSPPRLSTQGPSCAGSGQGHHPTSPHSRDPVPRAASKRPTPPWPGGGTHIKGRPKESALVPWGLGWS
ncbi:carcinoembryonic antigen-related cell adhesion molecule 4-like isoform X3 [Sturnira hondurensis]|uniref:carcinoembryonic antigen-related cell adhesion molecule 4-like isoform X3 n=1 Tax=Sturnira hondurensis TaxID=192404 RepID=UPI00187AF154|nr:carcinoembryonic antigen-related cell adhesion molecule 4-like isoform X3 [Sturnira hondurensis]